MLLIGGHPASSHSEPSSHADVEHRFKALPGDHILSVLHAFCAHFLTPLPSTFDVERDHVVAFTFVFKQPWRAATPLVPSWPLLLLCLKFSAQL